MLGIKLIMSTKSTRREFIRAAGTVLAVTGLAKNTEAAAQSKKTHPKSLKAVRQKLRNTGRLKAGAATRVVNPTKPAVPIGHGGSKPVSDPVYSDICTQALVLEDEFRKRLVLISCDFMQVPHEVADRIKRHIREKYGIGPTAVCVHAIHNHAAPPIIEREVTVPEYFDAEYAGLFVNQTVAVVGDAIAKLTPAKLRYCEDVCTSVAINRRGRRNGKLGIIPNNKGIVDFKVRVVAAESIADGKPIVILTEYASHPVVTTNVYLGGEYPSFVRKHVEKKYPGATSIFLQGCAGNIRIQVLNEDRTDWIKGTPEDAERFGFDLADAVERALTKRAEPIVGPIEAEYAEIAAPLKRDTEPKTLPFRIQAFRLGARSKTQFTLVALGAEAFIEYGLELEKRLRPANTIVIGYSNGMAGYLPTAKACIEGGYEPNAWSEHWYALPGPYAPEAESVILEAAEKLARPEP